MLKLVNILCLGFFACVYSYPSPCPLGSFFQHGTDCSKYYQCAPSGAQEMSCPAGLYWDQPILTCNWYREGICDLPTTTTTRQPKTRRPVPITTRRPVPSTTRRPVPITTRRPVPTTTTTEAAVETATAAVETTTAAVETTTAAVETTATENPEESTTQEKTEEAAVTTEESSTTTEEASTTTEEASTSTEEESSTTTEEESSTTTEESSITQEAETTTEESNTLSTAEEICAARSTERFFCRHPDPARCSDYIFCIFGELKMEASCASGYYFDSTTLSCSLNSSVCDS